MSEQVRFVKIDGHIINPQQIVKLSESPFYMPETTIYMSNGISFIVFMRLNDVIDLICKEPLVK